MKNILLLLLLFVGLNASAQNPEMREVSDFTTVKVFDRMRVNLIKSTENKIVLSGRDVDEIKIVNDDGVLKVRMELDKIFDGNETFVEVHYTDLRTIDGNEGAEIVTNELIVQDSIGIRAQEGASINAGLEVKKAEIRAVTGGVITARGSAEQQDIELNTGGQYEGRELETKITHIRIQAGGEAEIHATKRAEIKIRAGGDVDVYGNPEQVIKDKFIGGSVRIMD